MPTTRARVTISDLNWSHKLEPASFTAMHWLGLSCLEATGIALTLVGICVANPVWRSDTSGQLMNLRVADTRYLPSRLPSYATGVYENADRQGHN
ncbi:hypothetical protein L210DRAFT_2177364 [Boletus edulis BED1]|uniref:Uncharacterized protein n=1 Tax=Boletus edulis BED1 TaxID=1328754 RepID=A0AAD4BBU7_BOLED|nr:hypothetical protein L210DRAFT_2556892 [Boletus edulis BED1]KAF8439750.1 hypothetical protein L210DRAFT_2177364 [Boletus edulis BED1]